MPSPAAATETETAARLRAAIGRLSRRLRPTPAAREAGLTPTRVTILLHVVRRGRTRLGDLAAAEGINPTMLSRAVSDLAQAGLLARVSDEGDRRAAWIESTPAGRRLAERMRKERTEAVSIALADLPPAARHAVEAALPALEALADRLAGCNRA
ncbi:MAG: MarR family winged helix-turn-helix transcriptional regulator [Actinobacteria bacterium]|nr:MarR family winged helix-turn-helix transcriptional regulator [Actinomycetota bacterium]